MKGRAFAIAAALTLLATARRASANDESYGAYSTIEWPATTTGHYNVDVDVTIEKDPSPAPRFFTHQFGFYASMSAGYIGLQTVMADTGKKGVVFSVWDITSGTPGAPGAVCHPFDGEGVGYSCRLPYEWTEGRTYRLRVWFVDGGLLGAVLDRTTGVEQIIGTLGVPTSNGYLDYAVMWTEDYGPITPRCEDEVLSRVRFSRFRADDETVASVGLMNTYAMNHPPCPMNSSAVEDHGDAVQEIGWPNAPPPPSPMMDGGAPAPDAAPDAAPDLAPAPAPSDAPGSATAHASGCSVGAASLDPLAMLVLLALVVRRRR